MEAQVCAVEINHCEAPKSKGIRRVCELVFVGNYNHTNAHGVVGFVFNAIAYKIVPVHKCVASW